MDFDNPISPEQENKIKLSTRILPLDEPRSFGDDYHARNMSPEEKQRFEKVLEGARAVGENRRRFWNMLVSTVERAGYVPPQRRQTEILDMACGKCEEGIVLNAFFGGGEFGYSNNNVRLTGIDINKESIEKAIQKHQKPDFSEKITKYVLPENYQFIAGDATSLDQYPEIPKQADVVVIRHEQISDNGQIWSKIFQQALQRVTDEGIVLITSFSDIEHKMALEALQKLDCEVVVSKRNNYARPLSHKEVSLDKNVAVIKKKVTPK